MKKFTTTFYMIVFSTVLVAQGSLIKFDEQTHQFGTVSESDTSVMHKFRFENTSEESVTVLRVRPSCGCTTPDWTQEQIAPGGVGYVTAKYNPKGRPGSFDKGLNVFVQSSSGEQEEQMLFIKGKVEPDKEVRPNIARVVPAPSPYQEFFTYNKKDIKDNTFNKFINDAANYIREYGFIKLQVESSASHVPTATFKTNTNLTKHRAEEAKELILIALERQGIKRNTVEFIETKQLVQGPAYKGDYVENRAEYEKYQYVKIYPV